jgi:hypothetical protein
VIGLAQRSLTKAYQGDLDMHVASSIVPDLTPLLQFTFHPLRILRCRVVMSFYLGVDSPHNTLTSSD